MPVSFPFITEDLSDFMRKSVYDKNDDGIVDKLDKVTDIEELKTGFVDGQVPKISDGITSWDDYDSANLDEVNGGTF